MPHAATWMQQTGYDGRDAVYSSLPIKCRWTHKVATVKTIDGDVVECRAIVACMAEVESDDILVYKGKSYPVLGLVSAVPDVNGRIWWRELAMGGAAIT